MPRAAGAQSAGLVHIGFILKPLLVGRSRLRVLTALQRTREFSPQEMSKVGDRAGPGAGGCAGTPGGRALSHCLLGKLNTWPSTVPPATHSLMKEQDEVRGRRESEAKARKARKKRDFRESQAEARKARKIRDFRAHEAEPRKARKTRAFSCSKEGK